MKKEANEELVRSRKWELLRAIQSWQDAEPDSTDERECNERMQQAERNLAQVAPDYTNDFVFFDIDEMSFRLKQDLCPDKIGKRV